MDTATLLEHRDFVLHVARALLRDEADAQDATQDTYVAALQSAPPRTGRVRPWLGGIVRNIARNRRRSELRRVSRETRVARPDRNSGAAESSDRLAWQQRVVEAVLALDPKYRDVLVLRFYEDLPPREVANQLDIPVNTVRTRTRRAIERLRGVFDTKYGGRAAWSAAIAGLLLAQSAAVAAVPKLLVAATLLAVTAGTAALWHSTTRGEAGPVRGGIASATDNGSDRDSSQPEQTPGKSGKDATRAQPTRFHGRLIDYASKAKAPLVGATVSLAGSGRDGRPIELGGAETGSEGRFAFDWESAWKFRRNGEHLGYLLFVRHGTSWSDPIFATKAGFEETGFEAQVQLIESPRFQFVTGPSRSPVAGAHVSLYVPPEEDQIELGAPLASVVTDERGFARPEWPSWASRAVICVERPNGEVLQWQFDLQHVRSYDPYDLALDGEDIATVRVQVLGRKGKPAGTGVLVSATGSWAPDGLTEGPYTRVAHGAEPVPLVGRTDDAGIATFRFPADRAREGLYLPQRIVAFDARGGVPQYAVWVADPQGSPEAEGARSGNALPILQFGATTPQRHAFAVHIDEPDVEIELYWRGEDGRVRSRCMDDGWEGSRAIRAGGYSIYTTLDSGDVGASNVRGEVAVVTRYDDRIGWVKLDEATFARCLRGEAVIEPGALRATREVTVRLPKGTEIYEVWLESVEVPFLIGDSVNSDGTVTIPVPEMPGEWRVLLDREMVDGKMRIDPRKRTDWVLDPDR